MLRAVTGIIFLAGTLILGGCGEKQTDVAPEPPEREAEALVAQGVDVNARDSDGMTRLCRAAGAGLTHDVQVLIMAKADVNAKGPLDRSPLRLAAGGGYREVAELLIKAGADVNARDFNGRTPLHAAARGERELAGPFFEPGRDGSDGGPRLADTDEHFQSGLSESEMQQLIRDKQAIAQMLIDAKADVNPSDNMQPNGMTPLYIAARNGCKDMCELLIKAGANVNALSDYGMTPLHAAALGVHKEIAEVLIKAGANVNAKDNGGGTPLSRALNRWDFCEHPTTEAQIKEDRKRTADLAQLLISCAADVNAKDNGGGTPLHEAAGNAYPYPEVVEMLLRAGAKVNARDNSGQTPLVGPATAPSADAEVVEMLLKAGADPNPPFGGGTTLLTDVTMLGNFAGHAQVAKLLVKAGAHVNVKDKDHGATPLHYAVGYCNDKALVELIIKAGADVNAKSNDGYTPLALALRMGDQAVAELLRQHGAK